VDNDVILRAINEVSLTDLIEARGLHGVVEEGGRNFSGGERQRLELACALIQNPDLLILDEATSALDEVMQTAVINHLRKRQITIVFIAHRLRSIEHCHQIMVMKQGSIIESGTHAELLANSTEYNNLLNADKENAC
jgi:ABC-type multidrug transport system fused ATPase/permease subunit